MTLTAATTRNDYTATSGQTVFPYTFTALSDTDIKVVKNGVTLTLGGGNDYTVSGIGSYGGNVTLNVGATTGDTLSVYLDMPIDRTTNYQNSGDFLAADVNGDVKKAYIAMQQLITDQARSLGLKDSDPTVDMTIPLKDDRKNKFLHFNAVTGAPEAKSPQEVTNIPSSYVYHQRPESGAISRSLDNVLNESLSATDFGASGLQLAVTSTYGNNQSVGDTIRVPKGVYGISATLSINNSAQTYDVDCITLKGAGRESTIIDATGSSSGPAVELVHSIFNNVSDLSILNGFTSGINIDGVSNTSPGQRTNFERVQSKSNGTEGFAFERSYLCKVSQCNAEENGQNGFYHNFQIHTSWLLENNYGRLNGTPDPAAPTFYTGAGFKSDFNVYSAYVANAADENRYGYHILGNRGVSFISNGAEFNARSGFFFESSSSYEINWVSGIGNTCGGNNKQDNGFANHTHVKASDGITNFVVQKQPVSFATDIAGTYDHIATGQGAKLVLEDPLMYNSGARAFDSGFIQTNYTAPKLIYNKAFTASTAETLTALDSSLGTSNDFSGELLITAYNSAFGTAGAIGTATYKLLISKSVAGEQVVEIAKLGLVTGASASHPSFSFSVSGGNLVATPLSTTAGNFWFALEKVGGNFIFE